MLKVKDLIEYVKYRNSLSPSFENLPDSPLVYSPNKRLAPSVLNPETFVLKMIPSALKDLGLPIDQQFSAEEFDLLHRKLRQMSAQVLYDYKKELMHAGIEASLVPKSFRTNELMDALILINKKAKDFKLEKARMILGCDKENLLPVEQLCVAWTGKKDSVLQSVISHFLWLIKRKINGLPVSNHLMLILFSGQGSGKSNAVYRFLSPFQELGLVLYCSVSQLADERYFRVLSEHFVAFCDEMTSVEKTEINSLKNIITAGNLTPRKLGTNTSFHIQQNCSFIGASNRAVNEMLHDQSGARRFFQINCLSRMNWEEINRIDYLELVKGIDERRDLGYLTPELLEQVKARQKEIVSNDDIHLFLEDFEYLVCQEGTGHFIPNDLLYANYSNWIVKNGVTFRHPLNQLLKRLRNRGYASGSKTIAGKTHRGLWVNVGGDK